MSFIETALRGEETLVRMITKFLHQKRFRLAQIEKILYSSTIFFSKSVAMRSVECLSLLERSELFVGNEEFEVAAIMI